MIARAVAAARFERSFAQAPEFLVRAPGRVNIIGEHVDYNDGLVLPMAIGLGITVAAGQSRQGEIEVDAVDLGATDRFAPTAILRTGDWRDHVRGAAAIFRDRFGEVPPLALSIAGDLPHGAGLSSSAALGVGVLTAFAHAAGVVIAPAELARMAQAAERSFVGTRCGIMDHLASAAGRADHALLIDCRETDWTFVPWPEDWAILVTDSGLRRELASSGYNDRAERCSVIAERLSVASLRDVPVDDLDRALPRQPPSERPILRHVVCEIDRVRRAVRAIGARDLPDLGQLLSRTHASLRDDYAVSLPAIDALVALQNDRLAGAGGARLMGGGFGGCTLAVMERARLPELRAKIEATYRTPDGLAPWTYVAEPGPGVSLELL